MGTIIIISQPIWLQAVKTKMSLASQSYLMMDITDFWMIKLSDFLMRGQDFIIYALMSFSLNPLSNLDGLHRLMDLLVMILIDADADGNSDDVQMTFTLRSQITNKAVSYDLIIKNVGEMLTNSDFEFVTIDDATSEFVEYLNTTSTCFSNPKIILIRVTPRFPSPFRRVRIGVNPPQPCQFRFAFRMPEIIGLLQVQPKPRVIAQTAPQPHRHLRGNPTNPRQNIHQHLA